MRYPCIVLLIATMPLAGSHASAQPAAGANAAGGAVTMDFPADGVELRTLAEIVTRRLKIPIIYDESINTKKVVIRVPVDVPESALMGILQSALRMKQMALVDADQPGWKQIVPATNLAAVAKPAAAADAGGPIIEVFNLKHADPTRLIESVKPFLTPQQGTIQSVTGQKSVIITDYPAVVQKAEQILKLLDEVAPVEAKFIQIKNADPGQVAQTVQQIVGGREGQAASGVTVTADDRTGQVIVIGPKARLAEVEEMVAAIDKPVSLETKVYRLKSISPERLDKLVKGLVGSGKRSYQSSVDRDSQSLVVTATDDIHKRIATLARELDAPLSDAQNPVRFYKLKNTRAGDVLATLSSLIGEGANVVRPAGGEGGAGYGRSLLGPPTAPAENRLPVSPGAGLMQRGMGEGTVLSPTSVLARPRAGDLGPLSEMAGRSGTTTSAGAAAEGARSGGTAERETGEESGSIAKAKTATVTADVNTNSIIVIAPPAVQDLYATLIAKLDQRRPQVQIECTIVTLDTTDNFSFGVDIGTQGGIGASNIISFGSFGIATVNPKTGGLTPVAAPGGTFALLTPGGADVVIRALASSSRARLVSAPQLLVNDNGKGKLESVNQEPFAEILDTGTTQSRTGLGGLAQAGTTITVEPHISEGDYLQLGYSIELSSFTGTSRQGLPPPSQKNSVDSSVTIPDNHTIVVGGLHVKNNRQSKDSLPILENIPVLEWLVGSRSRQNQDLALFVFIRPVILRDDRFEDLKHVSDRALDRAGLPPQYPASTPIPLK